MALREATPSDDLSPILACDIGEKIATITLQAPQRRNSLSIAMIAALQDTLEASANNPDISAIVIAAEGPAYCAGHDLKELSAHREDPDKGRAHFEQVMGNCATLMQTIVRSPKPVIAAVEKTATAAGCQLVASCDLAVASEDAKFCTPGVNIGLFCSTPMVALSRNVSRKRAMEMLLLGDMIDAGEAKEFGLVNRVVPSDKALEAGLAMAKQIAAKSPVTVAIGKEAFYRQIELGMSDAYDYAAHVMVENMLERDAKEGISAFMEKRKPEWTDGGK